MNRRVEITQAINGYTVRRTDGEHEFDDLIVYSTPEHLVSFLLTYFTPNVKWTMTLEGEKP